MGRIKARALSRARINKTTERITHLDVRALQSDHGHGRATDVTGADAANLKRSMIWVSKKAALMLPTKTKLRDRSRENGKRKRNLFRRADDDDEERRGENDVREKARIRSVLLVILTIIIILFCVCVCVFVRV